MQAPHRTLSLLLLSGLALAVQDSRDEDLARKHREQVERTYAAAEWARGPVRAGLANDIELGGLEQAALEADGGRVLRRYRRGSRQDSALLVTSRVADTPIQAHAELVTWLCGLQSVQPMPPVPGLGDVGHLGASGAAPDAVSWVAFVRGNVFVLLNNTDPRLEPDLDLVDLAKGIDLGLLEVPELPAGVRPVRPVISGLSLAETQVVAGARVRLTATTEDGHGGSPELTWSVGGSGLGYVERAADGELYLFTTGPGRIELHLELTSSMGTFTRSAVPLEVLDD